MKLFTTILIFACLSFFTSGQEPNPEMVFVKGGKFKMGSNLGVKDEQPVHTVFLDDFYIGKFEIIQEQWKWIMTDDTNKRFFEGCGTCPVERVSWYNVLDFIEKLNQKTGLNYRLPTEAEWEYAAKGVLYQKDINTAEAIMLIWWPGKMAMPAALSILSAGKNQTKLEFTI